MPSAQAAGKGFGFLGHRTSPVSPQQIQAFEEDPEEIPLKTDHETRARSEPKVGRL